MSSRFHAVNVDARQTATRRSRAHLTRLLAEELPNGDQLTSSEIQVSIQRACSSLVQTSLLNLPERCDMSHSVVGTTCACCVTTTPPSNSPQVCVELGLLPSQYLAYRVHLLLVSAAQKALPPPEGLNEQLTSRLTQFFKKQGWLSKTDVAT